VEFAMAKLLERLGDNFDRRYLNLRAQESPVEKEIAEALETLWAQYEPYADVDFIRGFAIDPESRYWEMFLGCALLNSGHRSADRALMGWVRSGLISWL
jgi:hypothetical protein